MVTNRPAQPAAPSTDAPPSLACGERHLPEQAQGGREPVPPRPGEDFTPTTLNLAGLASVLLGWRPHEFWAATPAELATALEPLTPQADAPDRATLTQLLKDHPDG